ncbi:galactose oxidase-like domain-containing protein [Pyxidicoccus sp. 3LFB2]
MPRGLAVLFGVCAAAFSAGARAQVPSEVGQWTHLGTWPVSATHANLLPNGKVFAFGEFEEGSGPPVLWDPVTGALGPAATPAYNIFCSGHSFLADGRLLVTGGHTDTHVGLSHTTVYDGASDTWSPGPDMNDHRWYPTNTTLPNGDVAILSGETHGAGMTNELVQVYQTGAPGGGPANTLRDLTTAVRDLPYYPRMFVAPNGKLFFAAPRRATLYLDWHGTGTWWGHGRSLYGGRTYGSAVYFDGKVMIVGGDDPPTATAELIDLHQPNAAWRFTASMSLPRRQCNATMLPDGTVLVTGGSSSVGFSDAAGAVKYAEVFDPTLEKWTKLASSRDFHGYHSTSLLLPDGRVLHGGGRNVQTMEIFSPPYLFKGARPTIASAPDVVVPGTSFSVATPEAASIRKVTLIGLGAPTHAIDQGQRFLTLGFTATGSGVNITAPATNVAAPPGPYLLFLVDDKGVPSVGKVVTVSLLPQKLQRVVSFSDVWRYDASGADPGPEWRLREYDDSAWSSGPGQLGYGDDDEGTLLTRTSPSQSSVYFRRHLTLDRPVTRAQLELLFDDGVGVWVNGVPVFARHLDNGLAHEAYASASVSNEYLRTEVSLSGTPFVVGDNVIAVMVKQVSATSDDLTFALGLEVELGEGVPDTLTLVAPNGGEELIVGTSVPLRWNTSGSVPTVDLALSTDGGASWTPIASGMANTGVHTWQVPNTPTAQALVRVSRAGGGLPTDVSNAVFSISNVRREVLIPWNSTWKYLDTGVDPGTFWKTSGFDDGAWPSGMGQLGYGDSDETTVLTRTTPSQTSVYFRKKVTVSGQVTSATLDVLYDDGIVVYVNGTQVLSRNVSASNVAHAKYANAGAENSSATETVPPDVFVQGENTVAVVVKQVGATSPDLTFDLSLELGISVPPPAGR